ncbi:MAG: dihydroorotase [Lachnospiraceae bacterium]|nr:dihydroorotase [Lachnospiraceae bacterium]
MGKNRILIKNAHILSPADGLDEKGDILINEGVIDKISSGIDPDTAGEDTEVINAEGCYVSPGFVDVHCHFRDPGQTEKEDIHTGSAAAAAGGYTTVICMGNTVPAADSPDILNEIYRKAAEEQITVLQCGTVTEGRGGKALTDFMALKKAGAAGFTDDGSPIMDEGLVREAMEKIRDLDMIVSFHEEDPAFIGVAGINEGAVSKELNIKGADREAEISMVKRDLELALETGCRIDIQHVSALETVELIREAKKRDSNALIHAEVTPNHFSLTEDAVRKYGSLTKINPPLRTEKDRRALIEGLKDGTIDIIATDHAPHTKADKEKELPRCMSGIIGLETAFSLAVKNLLNTGELTLKEIITLMSVNPAETYGLDAGHITERGTADLVIFSTEEETVYDSFKSRSDNTPFKGMTLPGRIVSTIARGRKVY